MGREWVSIPGIQQRQLRNGYLGVPALPDTFLWLSPIIFPFWRSNPKIFRNQTREQSTKHFQPLARTGLILAYGWGHHWRGPLPCGTSFRLLKLLHQFLVHWQCYPFFSELFLNSNQSRAPSLPPSFLLLPDSDLATGISNFPIEENIQPGYL